MSQSSQVNPTVRPCRRGLGLSDARETTFLVSTESSVTTLRHVVDASFTRLNMYTTFWWRFVPAHRGQDTRNAHEIREPAHFRSQRFWSFLPQHSHSCPIVRQRLFITREYRFPAPHRLQFRLKELRGDFHYILEACTGLLELHLSFGERRQWQSGLLRQPLHSF